MSERSELRGKVAIVTGASKGIGAGIAKRFGAAGASVVVNYASSREGADKVVAEIKKEGGKAIAVKADVSKAGEVKQLFAETKRAFGKLDVLVNNAGVFRFAPLQDVTEDEFHREFNINVLGTLLATKEALNHFNGSGSVINLSSVVSTSPIPNSSVYAATKGAIDTLAKHFAAVLGPQGIRVNAVAPGVVATDMSSFAKTDEGITVHRVLHKNTFRDFLFRSKLPLSEDAALSKTREFWRLIEQGEKTRKA